MAIDDSDTCPICMQGERERENCKYWSWIDGEWVHDRSGIKGYASLIVNGEWTNLPNTPDPNKKGKDDDDDDKYPRRKRFGLW